MPPSPVPRLSTGGPESLSGYGKFYRAVASAQLTRWLPHRPARIVDLGGPGSRSAGQAAAAGHAVVAVTPAVGPRRSTGTHDPAPPAPPAGPRIVVGDGLGCLTDGCVDAVIADDRVLSRHLVTEALAGEVARVLRPGGRVLACVDSLVLGMAMLAEQRCWAALSDVPRAEVVLVPWPDGSITRCFSAEQVRELFAEAGLEVEWIRPRTVLSPTTVERVLADHPGALSRLVRAELAATGADESVGIHLVVSARRPGPPPP